MKLALMHCQYYGCHCPGAGLLMGLWHDLQHLLHIAVSSWCQGAPCFQPDAHEGRSHTMTAPAASTETACLLSGEIAIAQMPAPCPLRCTT